MIPRLLILPLVLGWSLEAQSRPQLVWEGEVDATSILYVRGNRLEIEDRDGLPVQRQRFRFYERLPGSRQNVEVRVVEGRGRVRVFQQPRLENDYTLGVSIEDRQAGSAFYSIELFWRGDDGFFGNPLPGSGTGFDGGGERLTWSGRVDGEAVISCRRSQCESDLRQGQPVVRERYKFSRPLPDRPVRVSLEETRGRGEIRLLAQPLPENDHTAQVLIRDPQGGAGDYAFSLAWARPSRQEKTPIFARRGMVWAGTVDDQVRIIVQGREARSDVVRGAPVSGERVSFDRELPPRDQPNASVRKIRGRGQVEILEYPSRRNGYRLIFEIRDSKGGVDHYEVEAGW
ncbi:MAG: hypothetical protein ACK5AZ_04465 [Bryobacteraceae bacterium]